MKLTFKELRIGDTFEFKRGPWINLISGPWVKVTPRTYVRVSDGMRCKVGTVHAEVERKEAL
jgi:hypothetical protein